jgi:hypothetical protein
LKPLASGDVVLLVRLEPEFFNGIDVDDVSRLKAIIGKKWTVEGFEPQTGFIELLFAHPEGSKISFDWVTVPPEWIERQSS